MISLSVITQVTQPIWENNHATLGKQQYEWMISGMLRDVFSTILVPEKIMSVLTLNMLDENSRNYTAQ